MAPSDISGANVHLSQPSLTLNSSPTPLKVRGRKRQGRNFQSNSGKRLKSFTPIEQATAPPASLHGSRKLSRLESLPLEIIEPIFLECMNTHLPRAVPVLGVKLSTEHTYTRFMRRLLCPDEFVMDTSFLSSQPGDVVGDYVRKVTHIRRIQAQNLSLALQARWATFEFFQRFQKHKASPHDSIRFEIPCSMPAKLLRWPLSPRERTLFLALANAGASVHPASLEAELAADVWDGALETADFQMLQCLVDRGIGRLPTRDERMWALSVNDFDISMICSIQSLRQYDYGRLAYMLKKAVTATKWPQDWPHNWPESDPEVCAVALEKYGVTMDEFSRMLAFHSDRYRDDGSWTVDFRSMADLP